MVQGFSPWSVGSVVSRPQGGKSWQSKADHLVLTWKQHVAVESM